MATLKRRIREEEYKPERQQRNVYGEMFGSRTSPINVALDEGFEQMAVLSISNAKASGEVVLNDLKLLELLQVYPFLYNRRVHPYRDPDYDEWAWECIAAAFNRSYNDTAAAAASASAADKFTINMLQERWEQLQPIVLSLSRACDLNNMPPGLRQMVVKISVQLEDQTTDAQPKLLTTAQSIVLDNIALVNRLPLIERKRLEAEIMSLILTSELDSKGTVKMNAVDMKRIDDEYESCLRELRLPEPYMRIKSTDEDQLNGTIADRSASQSNDTADITCSKHCAQTPKEEQAGESSTPVISASSTREVLAKPAREYKPNIESDDQDVVQRSTPSLLRRRSTRSSTLTPDITAPANRAHRSDRTKRWVPLYMAHNYIRPCTVRLRRANLEDYVPLSSIKRECTTNTHESNE